MFIKKMILPRFKGPASPEMASTSMLLLPAPWQSWRQRIISPRNSR